MTHASLVLLLLWPAVTLAAPMTLLWNFDRSFQPPPDRFSITRAFQSGADILTVPPSAPGACGQGQSPDTYCAILPDCPGPGVHQFLVQAVWDTLGESAPSTPVLLCVVAPQWPCQCTTVDPTADGPPVLPTTPAPPASPRPPMPVFPTLPPRTAPT